MKDLKSVLIKKTNEKYFIYKFTQTTFFYLVRKKYIFTHKYLELKKYT